MNTFFKCLIFTLIAALSVAINASGKPEVLASIRPLQLIVNDLAGEWVESGVLVEGAGSPHHFAMRISDRKKIEQADLVVWIGPALERFFDDVLEGKNRLTFTELPGLSWPVEQHGDHDHPGADPHVWLSLDNVAIFAKALTGRLVEIRPDLDEELNANLNAFNRRLAGLRIKADKAFENSEGSFAVYHDGFRHFTKAHHLDQAAALTLVPEEQISAKRLAQLKAELQQAKCLIVDKSELHTAERYAQVLELPLVQVDLLAADSAVGSYVDYYQSVANSFASCLSSR